VQLPQGLTEEAKELARQAAELCARDRAEQSPSTQRARFILASVLLNSDEMQEVLKIHKGVLRAREDIYGKTHPMTKDSIYTIGEIYRLKGKFEKAE